MKIRYMCAATLGMYLSGCTEMADSTGAGEEGQVANAVSRPLLSSICSSICNNSHNVRSCFDQRALGAGAVDVSVFPLIEGTTFQPTTILGTTTGWSSTSCPNCQWQLQSVTNDVTGAVVKNGITLSAINVIVLRNSISHSDWFGHVNIAISDPTDASVGVCNLSVGIELVNGAIQ